MKQVLILCYYFPPCNGAPSWRPYSWVQHFHKHSFYPTIITRHWTGKESTWDDFLVPNKTPLRHVKEPHYEAWLLPSRRYWFNGILERNSFLRKLLGNIYFLTLAALGRFNTEVDARLTFNSFLKKHLKTHRYDAVIISGPPSNIFELISTVKKHSDAWIVADIRDLWHNLMLTVPYRPALKQRVWDFFYARSYKKWLSMVNLVTVIIEPFKEVLKPLTDTPVEVVYNGFEAGMFSAMKKNPGGKFVFSVVGNIYPQQDMHILLEGLREFLKDKSSEEVAVRFIGAGALPEVAAVISKSLPAEFLHLSARVSKEEALQETLNADVLSFCGWTNVRGMISTKAFDYIASGNYILIAPGDQDALDKLVAECKCGKSVNAVPEFVETLNSLFEQWKEKGSLPRMGDKDRIHFYSREHQVQVMAELLNKNMS